MKTYIVHRSNILNFGMHIAILLVLISHLFYVDYQYCALQGTGTFMLRSYAVVIGIYFNVFDRYIYSHGWQMICKPVYIG